MATLALRPFANILRQTTAASGDPIIAAAGDIRAQEMEAVADALNAGGVIGAVIKPFVKIAEKVPVLSAALAPVGLQIGGLSGATVVGGKPELLPVAATIDAGVAQMALGGAGVLPKLSTPGANTMFPLPGLDFGSILNTGLSALNQYMAIRAQQSAPAVVAASAPMPMPVALPSLPAIGGAIARALPGVVGGAVTVGARVALRGIQTAYGWMTRKRAVSIARMLGIGAAAEALRVSAVELAELVMAEEQRKTRRGGITSAQMRTTRRTIGKIERAHRQIVAACSSARVPYRGRARSCPPPKVIVARK